jgi:creatinine amidohydrolase/Fe(II)-dependent formamide hydrolase-like protein
MEVRDLIKQGSSRIIIPTGGIEQNGPFVALNKHDLIARRVTHRIAELVGNTLVAPVVSFVPEGGHVPPTGHMLYPGTISLTEETFVSLLHDIGSSMITHGFKDVIILGDSGDSQRGMQEAAERLTKERGSEARIRFVPEFYDYESVRVMLRKKGFPLTPEQFHEELPFTLQLLAIDPRAARFDERKEAGLSTLNGTSIADLEAMAAVGREIIELRAIATANAILSADRK